MTCAPANPHAKENVSTTYDRGDEEDEASFNRYIKVVQQECCQERPNQHVLTELMSAAFNTPISRY